MQTDLLAHLVTYTPGHPEMHLPATHTQVCHTHWHLLTERPSELKHAQRSALYIKTHILPLVPPSPELPVKPRPRCAWLPGGRQPPWDQSFVLVPTISPKLSTGPDRCSPSLTHRHLPGTQQTHVTTAQHWSTQRAPGCPLADVSSPPEDTHTHPDI